MQGSLVLIFAGAWAAAPPPIAFRSPLLVGQSNTTIFWIPNTQGGIVRAGADGLIITADEDGDGIAPTNCSSVYCQPTVYFSQFRASPSNPSSSVPALAPWVPLNTTVPHHRLLIEFKNGTHRGFDSEIVLVSLEDKHRAKMAYTDWTYDSDTHALVVVQRGWASVLVPQDVQILYKTTKSFLRMQVGGVRLPNGTRLVVAEGCRNYPAGYPADASNGSTFLLASHDEGLHWAVNRVFDRVAGMPVDIYKGTSYVIGPTEPSIALLPDGKTLVIVARMANGMHLWQTFSRDLGANWTPQRETCAWAVYPQLLTLSNGQVLLASGRPSIGLWLLDQATMSWTSFHNLAAAHNSGLAAASPNEWRFPAPYARIDTANATVDVDFHNPLTKAYLGIFELGCEGSACHVIVMYDKLGNGNGVPPGPAGEHDMVWTMEAVVQGSQVQV